MSTEDLWSLLFAAFTTLVIMALRDAWLQTQVIMLRVKIDFLLKELEKRESGKGEG